MYFWVCIGHTEWPNSGFLREKSQPLSSIQSNLLGPSLSSVTSRPTWMLSFEREGSEWEVLSCGLRLWQMPPDHPCLSSGDFPVHWNNRAFIPRGKCGLLLLLHVLPLLPLILTTWTLGLRQTVVPKQVLKCHVTCCLWHRPPKWPSFLLSNRYSFSPRVSVTSWKTVPLIGHSMEI